MKQGTGAFLQWRRINPSTLERVNLLGPKPAGPDLVLEGIGRQAGFPGCFHHPEDVGVVTRLALGEVKQKLLPLR